MLLTLLQVGAADLYVAADGKPTGPGTLAEPYDLETALTGSVGRAGDTFWLRGGTYSLGHVDTRIHGEAGNPFTFRPMPGEKPRVDGSFTIWDSIGHVIFRDFELFNSEPKRLSIQTRIGFNPTDITIIAGIQSYSPNCSFINLVIHNHTRHGIYVSQRSNGNLIHGCLLYNNGWRSPDNAEGHSLYIQGSSGTREISDNLLFNSAGAGMHVYENGGQPLVGVTIDGNVAFNASTIQNVRAYRDWIIGADSPSQYADQIVFKNNMGYRRPGSATTSQVEMGREGVNGVLTMTDNYMPLGLIMNNWTQATVTGNTFAPRNSDYAVDLRQDAAVLQAAWNDNTYSGMPSGKDFRTNSTVYTFSEWKSVTGYDSSSSHIEGDLTGTKVFVRPNRYEAGRANIIVYNWSNLDTVPVDVSSLLAPGTAFEVRNAQDFFAAPVLSGIFDGLPLSLPMRGLTVSAPLGGLQAPPPTGPTFNVFVLLPASSLAGSNTPPTLSSVGDQTIAVNTATVLIPFAVSDAETAADSIAVSGRSSNPSLVPSSGIVFGGSGSNRTVLVTPAVNKTGKATLILAVSDGSLSSNRKFVLTVNPPPTVALNLPVNGTSYPAPATIDLAASVTPNGNTVSTVRFYHGTTLLGEDETAPYNFTWSGVSTGSYSLSAQAGYGAGSTVDSSPVNVVVADVPPSSGLILSATSGTITPPFVLTNGTISQPVNTSVTTGGGATYSFAVSTAGDYRVSALVNAPDGNANSFFVNIDAEPTDPAMTWDIPLTGGLAERTVSWRGNGTFDDAQFAPKVFTLSAGTHQLIVRGREANCELGTIVLVPYDTNTPPFITLTAPGNGATVSGPSVTVSANASDNDGVAGVQFKLDGENLGEEDTNAPYNLMLNTMSILDGEHTLIAGVRDAAGNQASSTPVSILVSNSVFTPLPTITVAATDTNATRVGPETGEFTITRTGSTASALTVNYSFGGTAVNGTDCNPLGTSAVISSGAASTAIAIEPKSATNLVGSRAIALMLSASADYLVGASSNATVTIAGNAVSISLINFTEAGVPIAWPSVPGKTYRVAYKDSLDDAPWTDLSGDITATGVSTSWTDETSTGFAERYYTVYVTN